MLLGLLEACTSTIISLQILRSQNCEALGKLVVWKLCGSTFDRVWTESDGSWVHASVLCALAACGLWTRGKISGAPAFEVIRCYGAFRCVRYAWRGRISWPINFNTPPWYIFILPLETSCLCNLLPTSNGLASIQSGQKCTCMNRQPHRNIILNQKAWAYFTANSQSKESESISQPIKVSFPDSFHQQVLD